MFSLLLLVIIAIWPGTLFILKEGISWTTTITTFIIDGSWAWFLVLGPSFLLAMESELTMTNCMCSLVSLLTWKLAQRPSAWLLSFLPETIHGSVALCFSCMSTYVFLKPSQALWKAVTDMTSGSWKINDRIQSAGFPRVENFYQNWLYDWLSCLCKEPLGDKCTFVLHKWT